MTFGLMPLSALPFGALAEQIGTPDALGLSGLLLAALTVLFALAYPSFRRIAWPVRAARRTVGPCRTGAPLIVDGGSFRASPGHVSTTGSMSMVQPPGTAILSSSLRGSGPRITMCQR